MRRFFVFFSYILLTTPAFVLAASESVVHGESTELFAETFLWIALMVLFAKTGALVELLGQPAVLGEIVVGVVLGNLGLLGFHFFDPIGENMLIHFLAELGVVLLLFQIGLESDVADMKRVGLSSFLVAILGVVVPFVLGTYLVGPWLLPQLPFVAHLFLGATLTATSVGITARVFQDLKKLDIREAKIVLGAAVIDDVLGLIILAIVSGIVVAGSVTLGGVAWIAAKAAIFLVLAVFLGDYLAPRLGTLFSWIHTGVGMKLALALFMGLSFAYFASLAGLAPIIGAFAAGLILDPVDFRGFRDPEFIYDLRKFSRKYIRNGDETKALNGIIEHHSHHHIEDLIGSLGHVLIPIFFIITGFQVKLAVFADWRLLLVALGITLAAIVGKVVSGLASAKGTSRWLVGFAMVPRGEVGLIFASIGEALGVVDERVFAAIVIMVILTTLVTPPILAALLTKRSSSNTLSHNPS